ncbi:phosphotransferase family protein (plasmid) [Sphingobium sp. SJ10-10]|uniref:phosphotransferase family protein n=1 Tax=Sphingobium sp. SJ10-10 TaxID=3114999 RepID=UPI002E16C369|nr:phosphotransferase family protein [Sphingobium sp. SJ10-10]
MTMRFTPDELAPILSRHLGGAATVLSVESFARGSSRETRFVRYRIDGGPERELVLRSDFPAGSTDPNPLDLEYFIYDRLNAADIPTARALFREDDPARTDRPFYAREKIEGDWNIPHYSDPDPAYDDLRIAIAREHIATLARVHAVDWQVLGLGERLPVPRDGADAAPSALRHARDQFLGLATEPIPLVLEAVEWLSDHAPPADRLCLCKGTNGYGEEVFRDGRIAALSDWEEVSIGDAAADFAFMQGFLVDIERDGHTLWGLQPALDYYESLTGLHITPEKVQYYQLVRSLRLLVMAHNSAASLRRPDAHIRQGWTATEVLHLTKHILASAMGMAPPIPSARFGQLNISVDMG